VPTTPSATPRAASAATSHHFFISVPLSRAAPAAADARKVRTAGNRSSSNR
jgi:hypothetical protein